MKEYAIQYMPFHDWVSCQSPGLGFAILEDARKKGLEYQSETGLRYRIIERTLNNMGLTKKERIVVENVIEEKK